MSRRYTAQEMRETAKALFCSEVSLKFDKRDIAAMLRQAADMMEREESEKEYEYVVRYFRRRKCVGRSARFYETLEDAKFNNTFCLTGEIMKFFRRNVGEWEEVPNE